MRDGLTIALSLLGSYLEKYISKVSFLITALIQSTITLLLLFIIAGYYVGLSNWGAPANYVLSIEVISEFKSFSSIITQSEFKWHMFIGLGVASLLLIYLSYQEHHLLATLIKKESFLKRYSFIAVLIAGLSVSVFAFYIMSKDVVSERHSRLKENEIFSAFISIPESIGIKNNVEWGSPIDLSSIAKLDSFDKKNVIFISVDCLRDDHLSFRGYDRITTPFIDSLYNVGVVKDFEVMTASCSNSFGGILSMLNSSEIAHIQNFKIGIHDVLKRQGYRTNFIVSGMHSSFYNLKYHYGNNIDFYREGADMTDFRNNDDFLILDALEQIEDYSNQPNFFFFHLMGPHKLGEKNKEFEIFKPSAFSEHYEEKLQVLKNKYDNGIHQSDYIIEQIFNKLSEKGYMDNYLVVISGDHGESMGENGMKYGHGYHLFHNQINIPILFIDTEIELYKESLYATQVDIAPTIVDRLGLESPEQWDGLSLLEKHPRRETIHQQVPVGSNNTITAVIARRDSLLYKYIYDENEQSSYLYELFNDPKESVLIDDPIFSESLRRFII